jgi:hypothetical protein
VWATGQWDKDRGILDVALAAKLDLAQKWGAEVFVPEKQADRWNREGLRLGKLKTTELDPRKALQELLYHLDAPPGQENFEKCREYYLRQPGDRWSTRAFYWSHLLDHITNRCKGQIQILGWSPQWLVTIVSMSNELAVLNCLALGVKHCLLLYTKELESKMSECLRYLDKQEIEAVPACFTLTDMENEIKKALQRVAEELPPEDLVIDLTPGTKKMTYTLSRLARPGNWLFYLESKFRDDRRSEPGTERIELWQAKS